MGSSLTHTASFRQVWSNPSFSFCVILLTIRKIKTSLAMIITTRHNKYNIMGHYGSKDLIKCQTLFMDWPYSFLCQPTFSVKHQIVNQPIVNAEWVRLGLGAVPVRQIKLPQWSCFHSVIASGNGSNTQSLYRTHEAAARRPAGRKPSNSDQTNLVNGDFSSTGLFLNFHTNKLLMSCSGSAGLPVERDQPHTRLLSAWSWKL